MSQKAEHTPEVDVFPARPEEPEYLSLESGLEALRESPEFHGPVEPLDEFDDHEGCEHLALFYESRKEQFATVVPFVRQGIERGERVMYVVDEHDRAKLVEALRGGRVDVDAALESGQLTFHTLGETYLQHGYFDPDAMLELYGEVIEETTRDPAYSALRVTADTKWILDEETTIEDFMEYESRVNELFEDEDCIALCHYDCTTIPAEILTDVVRTHPHLVYDNTVCHNFYYTPPEEYFAPDEPAREVQRMLGTLVDRTEARVELAETIEELEESNERLRRFAYIASHDLQEPLRMISTYLRLLENRHGDDLDEGGREYLDFAVDGADRMRAMVEGLLAYSRVDMHDGAFEPVDCDELLEGVLADLRVQIAESDATIDLEALPTVRGDARQLEQVFSNLLSNAITYSGDDPPSIEITADRHGSRYVFAVADEGIGMDPAHTDGIFEVFERLHSDAEYPGTGIGLALCRKIVAHHGGDIWVDSELGEGTTFYFMLPAAE